MVAGILIVSHHKNSTQHRERTATSLSVSIAVFTTVIVISSGEYLVRAGLGESNEGLPLALMTLGIATIAATVTAVVARAGSRWGALFAGVVVAWVPFASVSVVHAITLGAVFVATAGVLVRTRSAVGVALAAFALLATSLHHYGSQRTLISPRHRETAPPLR